MSTAIVMLDDLFYERLSWLEQQHDAAFKEQAGRKDELTWELYLDEMMHGESEQDARQGGGRDARE